MIWNQRENVYPISVYIITIVIVLLWGMLVLHQSNLLLTSPLPHLFFHSTTQLVPHYYGYIMDTLPYLLDDLEVTSGDQREASGMDKYCNHNSGE